MPRPTHCYPDNGIPDPDQVPVSNVSRRTMSIVGDDTGGPFRGFLVFLHGIPGPGFHIPPDDPVDTVGFLASHFGTWADELAADGWIMVTPNYPEDHQADPPDAWKHDVATDPGHGTRYLATVCAWWDHLKAFLYSSYGPWPIVLMGGSWGGAKAIQLAKNRTSDLAAYGALVFVTTYANINEAFITPTDLSTLNASALDITPHYADTIALPSFLGWHEDDIAFDDQTKQHTIYDNLVTAGRDVTRWPGTTGSHTASLAELELISAWLTSKVNPGAPKDKYPA